MMTPGEPHREGTVVARYRITAPIGRGGMGVVYKAQDLELNRVVALKFIPRDPDWDSDATLRERQHRFLNEARAASALDDPNIATIHTIEHEDDGQLFIVMSYYEGETLRQRLARGKLPRDDAIAIVKQIVRGLAKAHDAGIVHRDVKPGNVILTSEGLVKIIDFGLAKLGGTSRITATGTTLGNVAYTSPEQLNGDEVDARADVWSLGALAYELFTGQPAFDGPTIPATMHAVLNKSPIDELTAGDNVPAPWRAILKRALERDLGRRYPNARAMLADIEAITNVASPPRKPRSLFRTAAAIAAGVAALTAAGWGWKRSSDRAWVNGEAIPQLRRLVDEERFAAAAPLLARAQRTAPGDTALSSLDAQIVTRLTLTSEPSGAEVSALEYGDTSRAWVPLGTTPLDGVRLPRGLKRLRITRAGYDTLEVARGAGAALTFALVDSAHAGMVHIPKGNASAWIAGVDPIEGELLDAYYVDRFEVTNRAFKRFVDAGGYTTPRFWKFPMVKDGHAVDWQSAMRLFVDATGRPGPSTWEVGTYPGGQDEYPVSGVSWYEAAAYAEFAGKSLPTVYHWVKAASTSIPQYIIPLSNFGGKGKLPVGASRGVSSWGVFDAAGNVREWQWNASGVQRHTIGGAWNDPTYMFTFASTRDPMDRSADVGFRCAIYPDGDPGKASRDLPLSHRDYATERPVADEVFRAYLNQFSYDQTPLDGRVESDLMEQNRRHRVVTVNAAYGGERMAVHIYTPATGTPPFAPVVYYPGSGATSVTKFVPEGILWLVDAGRAVIYPVYKSTYERNDGLTSTWASRTHRHSEALIRQVKDFKRAVDYVATENQFDLSRLAYYGNSWGARMGAIIPAVDTRITAVVLAYGGLASGYALPEVDQINYAGRIKAPVLMLNGRFDAIEPYESAQLPLYRALNLPPDRKRHVVWDAAHGGAPVNAFRKEVLDWLDRFAPLPH